VRIEPIDPVLISGFDHPVVVEAMLGEIYRDEAFAVIEDGAAVAFASAHFESERKNAWTPYVNWVTAYTQREYRRRGYAKALGRHIEAEALKRGCKRLRSMAGSHLGVLLHLSLGHQAWGVSADRYVAFDTPLVAGSWPASTPISVRRTTTRTDPLTKAEVLDILGKNILRFDPEVTP